VINYLKQEKEQFKGVISYLEQEKGQFKGKVSSLEQEKEQFEGKVGSLEQEKEQFEGKVGSLEQEKEQFEGKIGSLEKEKEQSDIEISHKKEEIDGLKQDLSKNEFQYSALEKDYIDFKDDLARHKQALNDIKSGKSFKVIRFYATKIEKIKQIKTTFGVSREFIKKYGISSFFPRATKKIKQGKFTVDVPPSQTSQPQLEIPKKSQEQTSDILSSSIFSLTPSTKESLTLKNHWIRQQQRFAYTDSSEVKSYAKEYRVSVVIPTNSDENSCVYLLSKIKSQKGIKDLEIIFVNSGLHSLNSLQKLSNVKLINITSEEFNHGTTRNLGASHAGGEFIIFLSDDAIPANENLFYDLCNELCKNPQCGCVSARQIPRSDADLMHKSSISHFYKFLKHYSTEVKPNSFDKLTLEQKRSVSQIDDVCSCYRKNVFSKYQYTNLEFAEDLEMGIRLVKDAYKILLLDTGGVIHSHNRVAEYWVKRSFIEHSILNQLLNAELSDFKSMYEISVEEELLEVLWLIYNSLGLTIDFLQKNQFSSIHQNFVNIHQKSREFIFYNEKPKSSDPSMDKLFKMIFQNFPKPRSKKSRLLENYLGRLFTIEDYMLETYPSMTNVRTDLFDALYKIFGMFMGEMLSEFIMYSKKHNLKTKQLAKIEKILMGDV